MDGTKRSDIKCGMKVDIVMKDDQATGYLTHGVVKRLLTKAPKHPHGIKVELTTNEVGRVKKIY
jgi:uncharacterized repeat protein (TIGR03833 family)